MDECYDCVLSTLDGHWCSECSDDETLQEK